MLIALLVIAAGFALAALTYLGLERLGRRAWLPLACRAVAWSALGLLVVNLSCPTRGTPAEPLVLLDRSLSMGAAGGQWDVARRIADSLGEVRLFGDDGERDDTTAMAGRTLLAPALTAAAVSARPVVIVSDGEIEDAADIAPDLLAQASVQLLPRDTVADRAISGVDGPARVTAGDSLSIEVDVRGYAAASDDTVAVEVRSGPRLLGGRAATLSQGTARLRIPLTTAGLAPGDHLLRISIAGDDPEPRTDQRRHLLTVAPTPGIVLLASPGSWDARFLYRALADVADLPVRGYVRLERDAWSGMHDLQRVPDAAVRRAARGADLLVLKGESGDLATGAAARGLWLWPSGESGEAVLEGDWYLQAGGASPLAGSFLGAPVDSFPPATQLVPIEPAPGDWVALTALESRRGAPRPAVIGSDAGRRRRVTVAVDGLWRWAFQGGASEQAYRAWVGATVSWLLGGADSARGRVRAVRPVVQQGRPLVFEWVGGGEPEPTVLTFAGDSGRRTDTLAFDAARRGAVRLPPGDYRYTVAGGGAGTVAVEQYSDELLPRPVRLEPQTARRSADETRSPARDWPWLFGIAVLALAGEWLARRRLGLR